MFIRIVKLSLKSEKIGEFLSLFEARFEDIRSQKGCFSLQLLQDREQKNVFFTYSTWDMPESLEAYRNSVIFEDVWSKAKLCFNDKPEAWSVDVLR